MFQEAIRDWPTMKLSEKFAMACTAVTILGAGLVFMLPMLKHIR